MSSAEGVAADIGTLARATADKVHKVVVTHGAMMQTQARANASGVPLGRDAEGNREQGAHGFGPNAVTGNLRRTINRSTSRTAGRSSTVVGSSAPQARRLEHGFSGEDSLGRNYAQPAYPFLGPALDTVAPVFVLAVREASAL